MAGGFNAWTSEAAFLGEEKGLALVPPETGNYDVLDVDVSKAKGYDEVMVYSEDRSKWPEGLVDLQNVE